MSDGTDNQADQFSKARSERASALLEDYTELIADLTEEHGEARLVDIARAMGIAHPTAAKAVSRLKREGLATSRPYRGVFLTEAGEAMAEKARIRHALVFDLLLAVGVPKEAAELDAEGIEHHVSDETSHGLRGVFEEGLVPERTVGFLPGLMRLDADIPQPLVGHFEELQPLPAALRPPDEDQPRQIAGACGDLRG